MTKYNVFLSRKLDKSQILQKHSENNLTVTKFIQRVFGTIPLFNDADVMPSCASLMIPRNPPL